MITLVRIVGESLDLVTNEQRSKAVIISNGKRELSIPVNDDTARGIVELMLDSMVSKTMDNGRTAIAGPAREMLVKAPNMEVSDMASETKDVEDEYYDSTLGVSAL